MMRQTCIKFCVVTFAVTAIASASHGAEGIGTIPLKRVFADLGPVLSVRTDNSGNYYLLLPKDHSVVAYDHQRQFLRRIGLIGQGPGELFYPAEFAISSAGVMWIAEPRLNRVQVFGPTGDVVSTIEIAKPTSIAVLADGSGVVVSESDTHLARRYAQSGQLLRTYDGAVYAGTKNLKLNDYYNRARAIAAPAGGLYLLFRGLIPPYVRQYDLAGGTVDIWPEGPQLTAALGEARIQHARAVAMSEFALRGTLNAASVQPNNGNVWIAPSVPEVYVYSARGMKLGQYTFIDPNGKALGAHDLWISDGGEGFMVSSNRLFQFTLPINMRPSS